MKVRKIMKIILIAIAVLAVLLLIIYINHRLHLKKRLNFFHLLDIELDCPHYVHNYE